VPRHGFVAAATRFRDGAWHRVRSYDREVVEGDQLRAVMARFPAGVAVVSVELRGQRAGLTVASLVSLSLEPPLVGFAVRRDAALHELLRDSGELAVSMLAAGQEALAQHFARGVPPIALWTGIPLRDTDGPPQLDGAVAWLKGKLIQEHETGDHTFFVAEVEGAERGPAERPLVFHRQGYAAL
jgi:flavin reductase (DIM6/NTAB) family NADH-FMN oxidoreductase RutF